MFAGIKLRFICPATVILFFLVTFTLSKKKILKIRFNNSLAPGRGSAFEPGSVRSGFEHGPVPKTNQMHSHKIQGNYRGTVYIYFNVQSLTGVSAHRDPLPHRLFVVRTNVTHSKKIYGSYRGTVCNFFYHPYRIKDDSNIITDHNSRKANNSRNESNNRTANTVWTPVKAGMLAKKVKLATAWREAKQQQRQ